MSLEKRIGAALAPLFLMMSSHGAAEPVGIGKPAPEFRLLDQHGVTHSLANYRGRWLVIYFYPKDDTPGCTTEACAFRDDVLQLRRMDVGLVGISTDDVESHKEFANKYHLPFSLLSDRDGSVAQSYGSLTRIGPFKFAKRHTFIIGPEGRVERIYRDVNPKTHSQQVIGDLRALQAGG
jgi:peroxiredoxin Q/BCP